MLNSSADGDLRCHDASLRVSDQRYGIIGLNTRLAHRLHHHARAVRLLTLLGIVAHQLDVLLPSEW